MSCATDLEVDAILTLELNFFVVDASRRIHRAIHLDQGLVVGQVLTRRLCESGFYSVHRFCSWYSCRLWMFNWCRTSRWCGTCFSRLFDVSFNRIGLNCVGFQLAHEFQYFCVIHDYSPGPFETLLPYRGVRDVARSRYLARKHRSLYRVDPDARMHWQAFQTRCLRLRLFRGI